MNIIDYLPEKEALNLERSLIQHLVRAGQTIYNTVHTLVYQKPVPHNPANTDLNQMLKSVKYKRDWMVRHLSESVVNGEWQPYPENPFKSATK
jgi:hypothetical protein